jgi:dihydroflavonol-4-reductase
VQDYHEWRQLEMRILVTGSTGLLGNNIVRKSIDDGHQVVALIRTKERPKALDGLDVELAFGDVTDPESVLRAAKGVDAILHSAAQIHIGWQQRELSYRVNVEGTRAVVAAAKREAARLVHVSTVNTLAIGNREGTVDEDSQHDGQIPCTYVVSKRQAEQITVQAARGGLEACIVHPGFMLGPWDWKPSSGRMLLEVGKRWTPLAPSGGCSVCDVRDVARGVLLAMERGSVERHYILAGDNLTYLELWTKIARVFKKNPPLTIMRWPARILAGLFGDVSAKLRGTESDINSAALKMSSQFHCYSSQRACDELGYSVRPADVSIADAQAWFQEHGYISP